MKNLYSTFLILLGFLVMTNSFADTVDESANKFIQLLASKKYSHIVNEFYIKEPEQLARVFPEWAKDMSRDETIEMISDARNTFLFDMSIRYKEINQDLNKWVYLKTYYHPRPDESEYDEGKIIISLYNSDGEIIDRLDIILTGSIENNKFVLFGRETISFDHLWEKF